MNICLFTPEEISQPLSVRDERAQHIIKILHKKCGDSFTAGIIGGPSGKATIMSLDIHEESDKGGKKTFTTGTISFSFEATGDGKPLYPLSMVIGFPRPIQLKRLLRDMAGLGVQSVHLCITDLGEKSYLNSDLATSDAGYQMLLEGTVQAGGTHVPAIQMHKSLEEALDAAEKENAEHNSTLKIALDNVGPGRSLGAFLDSHSTENACGAVAAIGSERGWTERERSALEQRGYERLGMGCRILRTETASTVAASIILDSMGFLG